jgi:sugar lactone lactonase YvrE
VTVWRSNLEAVLGRAFDDRDRMYVLEMTTGPNGPTPFTGKVLRIDPSRAQHEISSGLFFPTGMTLGPDGSLYVSSFGFDPPDGQIVKITVPR